MGDSHDVHYFIGYYEEYWEYEELSYERLFTIEERQEFFEECDREVSRIAKDWLQKHQRSE